MAKLEILAGDFKAGTTHLLFDNIRLKKAEPPHSEDMYTVKGLDRVEIATEENIKKAGGTLGWGTLGLVTLGPVGLLAGLLLGGKAKEITFIAVFKSGKKFLAKSDSKTFEKLRAATFK